MRGVVAETREPGARLLIAGRGLVQGDRDDQQVLRTLVVELVALAGTEQHAEFGLEFVLAVAGEQATPSADHEQQLLGGPRPPLGARPTTARSSRSEKRSQPWLASMTSRTAVASLPIRRSATSPLSRTRPLMRSPGDAGSRMHASRNGFATFPS